MNGVWGSSNQIFSRYKLFLFLSYFWFFALVLYCTIVLEWPFIYCFLVKGSLYIYIFLKVIGGKLLDWMSNIKTVRSVHVEVNKSSVLLLSLSSARHLLVHFHPLAPFLLMFFGWFLLFSLDKTLHPSSFFLLYHLYNA